MNLCLLLLALQAPASAAEESLERPLRDWQQAHGSSWQISESEETAFAEMLYGGRVPSAETPESDSEWFELSRARINEARELLGVDVENLVEGRVLFLPLGWIGTSDKFTVSLDQFLFGVQVEGASANVLFDSAGGLLSIQTDCAVEDLVAAPFELDMDAAARLCLAVFERETGLEGELATLPRRAWWRLPEGGVRPAWITEAHWEEQGMVPVGRSVTLDAGDGRVLSSYSTVQHFDVTGSVQAQATGGAFPDWASNTEVWTPVPYVNLTGSFGTVQTDVNGDFVIPGITGPVDVTVSYEGEYALVHNFGGTTDPATNYSITTSVSDGGMISMNPAQVPTEYDTAQANAYFPPGLMRDWIRSINPSDETGDYQSTIRANTALSCNAYFTGGYIMTLQSDGVCPNTSYASIVAHELGHWLNNRYFTYDGTAWDGMGEGAADIFAMYLFDTPIVGQDFWCENCGPLRTGENTRQFCGDSFPGCYGSPHANGEPFMGATWKVRENLNTSLGDVEGDLTADSLWLGWNNVFNQHRIREIIETQWVLLDDDDGDIFNGSPHFADIDAAFRAQGWPGLEIQPITAEIVALIEDTEYERGPYSLRAIIELHFGQTISNVELVWRTSSTSWQTSPMVLEQDHTYVGSVPDIQAPAAIQYYLQVTDSSGNILTEPAPATPHGFKIGRLEFIYEAHFDDLSSDEGWTHGSYGDTSNGADDWERGWPQGAGGTIFAGTESVTWEDPSAPVSGNFCWGNDLGQGTDGRYPNNAHLWLRSPSIDASGWVGCQLRFQRQLSIIEEDVGRVRVNGAILYEHSLPFESDDSNYLAESEWGLVEHDMSHLADGSPALQLEWELHTDGNPRMGGWNIDDVEIWRLVAVGRDDCVDPSPYGPGKVHSGDAIAELSHQGQPSVGANFLFRVEFAVPNQPSILFSGINAVQIPFAGGHRLTNGDLRRHGVKQLSIAGGASFPMTVTPAMAGTTRFCQVWFRDPGHPDGTGVGLSPGLRVDYCQ